MTDVMNWHRDAAAAISYHIGFGQNYQGMPAINAAAAHIAANDPSAELLRECRDWIAYMPHKPSCACLRIINELGEAEPPCNCGRDSILSRLAEAGVRP